MLQHCTASWVSCVKPFGKALWRSHWAWFSLEEEHAAIAPHILARAVALVCVASRPHLTSADPHDRHMLLLSALAESRRLHGCSMFGQRPGSTSKWT